MFDHAPIGMALLSAEGRVELANDALARFLGVTGSSLVGAALDDLLVDGGAPGLVGEARAAGSPGRQREHRFRHASGADAWGLLSLACPDEEGDPDVLLQVVDLTDRKRAEAELAFRAGHDPLTGLANRARLHEEIVDALRSAWSSGQDVALLFCDLDHFKVVNDSLGHDAGDGLLVAVARRLAASLLPGELVGRFGGDEFVVVTRGVDGRAGALARAASVAAVLADPIFVGGTEVPPGASVGVAVAEGGVGTVSDLLRDADIAMYAAKRQGRGTVAVCDERMRGAAAGRLELQSALRGAAGRGELVVHYQPIFTDQREIHGLEALVRWQHPARGLLGPDAFLEVAEESGIVREIDHWVRDEALGQLARWDAQGWLPDGVGLWLNVSATELGDPGLAGAIVSAARRAGIDPARLTVEISERAPLDAVTGTLAELSRTGISLAVDDVGTGHAALADLVTAPIDVLKIDRGFVSLLDAPGGRPGVTAALFELARTLGTSVVAEGVETEAQDEALDQLGCSLRQGFLYARPHPPGDLREALGQGWVRAPAACDSTRP